MVVELYLPPRPNLRISNNINNNNNQEQPEMDSHIVDEIEYRIPKDEMLMLSPIILIEQQKASKKLIEKLLLRIDKLEFKLKKANLIERNNAVEAAGNMGRLVEIEKRLAEKDAMLCILQQNNLYFQHFFYREEPVPPTQQDISNDLAEHLQALKAMKDEKTAAQNSNSNTKVSDIEHKDGKEENPIQLDTTSEKKANSNK